LESWHGPAAGIGLSDDLRTLKHAGVDVVVSALTATETEELGLIDEAEACAQSGLLFVPFPIEDRSLPVHFAEFVELELDVHHLSRPPC